MEEIKRTLFSNLLLFLGILILTATAFFIGRTTANIEQMRAITGLAVKELDSVLEEVPEFSTYTKAICYNRTKKQYCHDALYARCQGKEYALPINLTNPIEMPNAVLPSANKSRRSNSASVVTPKK